MFIHDLSPYNPISDEHTILNTLAVGWLSSKYPFQTSIPSSAFLTKLLNFCRIPIRQTRGFHHCEFCDQFSGSHPFIMENNETIWLGSAEIRVIVEGKVYAAPNLIYHYVLEHHYSPPEEFINAVTNGPQPHEKIYQTLNAMYKNHKFTKLF